jgi:diguanylate cyclase (GGDEF)-like protein
VTEEDAQKTSPYLAAGNTPRSSRDPRAREACLVVLHGEGIGRRVAIGTASIAVGRAPTSDLIFEEECVSRNHCRIEPAASRPDAPPDTWYVVDLRSTNGTHVNDRSVERQALRHGDEIQIGRNICKFLASGHIESAYHEEIHRLVTTDGLTGLPNRRAFEEALQREFSRASRYKRPLSLLMIDVDFFKRVNDTLGHLAGDAALRQVGALLRGNLRRDDLAARLGGEEFAVLLPEIDRAGAVVAAEKLRRLVEARPVVFEERRWPLTISLGIACRGVTDTEAIEIVRRADDMLYAAKREGRNRVRG